MEGTAKKFSLVSFPNPLSGLSGRTAGRLAFPAATRHRLWCVAVLLKPLRHGQTKLRKTTPGLLARLALPCLAEHKRTPDCGGDIVHSVRWGLFSSPGYLFGGVARTSPGCNRLSPLQFPFRNLGKRAGGSSTLETCKVRTALSYGRSVRFRIRSRRSIIEQKKGLKSKDEESRLLGGRRTGRRPRGISFLGVGDS